MPRESAMNCGIDRVPTRKLLSMISDHREHNHSRYYDRLSDCTCTLTYDHLVKGGVIERAEFTIDEVRSELAKRPHIPNKQESKLLRKLKKQTGLTEEQIRKHPQYGQQFFGNREAVTKEQFERATKFGIDTKKWYVIK